MGATRRQMLSKVQLPLARRMLLLGVNQTILFALSMVVIAGLIGGGGLGAVVTSGLYTNPALAILGGIAIVIMAMALDRVDRGDRGAHRPHQATPRRRSARSGCGSSRSAYRRRSPSRSWLPRSSSASPRSTPTRRRAAGRRRCRSGSWPRSRASSTTCRTRIRGSSTSPSRSATSLLTKALLPLQGFLDRDAVVRHARRD